LVEGKFQEDGFDVERAGNSGTTLESTEKTLRTNTVRGEVKEEAYNESEA
jgi:hypothetical protein